MVGDRHDRVFAAIPVKAAAKSKTRLSNLFKPWERACLTHAMLRDVLGTVFDSQIFMNVVVISSDPEIQILAGEFGAYTLHEYGGGLNRAVEQVTRWCIRNGADSTLILPSDIPLLTVEDITGLVELGSEWRRVVASPSNDGGTNALLRTPPDVIPSFFGSESFEAHLSAAKAAGVKAEVYRSPSIALDIDSAEDIEHLICEPRETLTKRLIEKLNIRAGLKGVEYSACARAQ